MRLRRLRRLGILNSTVDGLEERQTLVHTKDGSDEERKHKQQRIDDDENNHSISEKTENNNEDDFAKNNETRKLAAFCFSTFFLVLIKSMNEKVRGW